MADFYNPKFRAKFLRTSTKNNTPIEPGNFIVDMDTGEISIDILNSDNQASRVTVEGVNLDDYVAEPQLQALINYLDDAANPGV